MILTKAKKVKKSQTFFIVRNSYKKVPILVRYKTF